METTTELTVNTEKIYVNMYKKADLPLKYMNYEPKLIPEPVDRECFKCLAKVQAECLSVFEMGNGRCLLLFSNNVGNGKTTWAQKILKSFIKQHSAIYLGASEYLYISVPAFLQLRKSAISDPEAKEQFMLLDRRIKKDRLVVFDDIAYCQGSGFDEVYLFSVIDHRYTNNMNSIFTSNATPDEMRKILGNRIADRILDSRTYKYFFQGGSRR